MARFYGRASKYPKMHCWPCLSWRLEWTARFYGKSSKYPKLHCWPYRSWKLQGTARFYGKASKCPKMHCWAYLSCKMKETTSFKCKMGSKCPKCLVGPIFRAGGNSPMLRQRGSDSLFAVYRKITWKSKERTGSTFTKRNDAHTIKPRQKGNFCIFSRLSGKKKGVTTHFFTKSFKVLTYPHRSQNAKLVNNDRFHSSSFTQVMENFQFFQKNDIFPFQLLKSRKK